MTKGQTVLITGAGRGIGMAVAETLAAEGYDLILNYRKDQGKSAANLQRFQAAETRVQVRLAKADIGETRDVQEMVKKLRADGVTRIDHLVLNAAAAPFKGFMEMTRSDWKLLFNANLIGNTACVQEMVPLMSDGSTICAISSMGSQRVLPKYPLGIAKSALENLVRYLEVELHPHNIRVNGVCAGMVNTDMAQFLKDLWPSLHNRYEHSPRRWLLEPKEVADIVSFLISERSSAIRGTTLIADLGMSLEA